MMLPWLKPANTAKGMSRILGASATTPVPVSLRRGNRASSRARVERRAGDADRAVGAEHAPLLHQLRFDASRRRRPAASTNGKAPLVRQGRIGLKYVPMGRAGRICRKLPLERTGGLEPLQHRLARFQEVVCGARCY